MPGKVLNWGFICTADINKALIQPLKDSKRNRLAAVASRTQAAAEAYAREWKIPRAFGSYEALLASPEVDVVYNALPNHLHAEWTIKALRAGKHVLCEKPFALTTTEVEAMGAAAQETRRVLAEAFMYRHHPQTLKVKEILEDGLLGSIKTLRGSFTIQFKRENNYRWNPEMGGGALWDVGCYPLSYMRAMLGAEPLEVFGWQVKGSSGIDEIFTAQLRFPGEILAQFDCSFIIPFHAFMELVGDEGTLIVPTPFAPKTKESLFLTREGRTEKISIKAPGLYEGEVEDMADAILEGKPPRISLADSRANVRAILALFESARLGQPVTL